MSQNRMFISSAAASCIMALSGMMSWQSASVSAAPPAAQAHPDQIVLTGIVRDFREAGVPDGHPDFEATPDLGFGQYAGNVREMLGEDGKPKWIGTGHKVTSQWKDNTGRPIAANLYSPSAADVAGAWGATSTGGVKNADSFDQWFRDVPGVNVSAPTSLTLVRQADGSYVFDDKLDPEFASKGGFFPIDDQLFGNSAGTPHHNYHFTFELHTEFVYDANAHQIFKFIGDDDVYVFINDCLVIDLGGVHSAVEQFVDLDRLGLSDGQTYRLDFFFAERHRTQSNFRIHTNLFLNSPDAAPTVSGSFD